ncbi:hypothetical protein BDR26DRAFT_881626 [Obelidium mucronatum]|nr:hypothetical protein BDR26DRAFT_881626 [Obelidium mucronatum]
MVCPTPCWPLKMQLTHNMKMLTTASISFSDLNELLYPLFISRLTAGNGLANPSIFTGFLHHTFPFVFPRTRLIQWADWILKDDAIIRREGVQSMTRLELLEALEERGFTALQDVSVEEMKSTLLSHTKWTKLAFDTIVNKRNWEKGVDVNSEAIVVPKVSRDLGLTSEELGGVAALLVVARALNVRV